MRNFKLAARTLSGAAMAALAACATAPDVPTSAEPAPMPAPPPQVAQPDPIDIDRALKSLSRIRPAIRKFWDTGALSAQMLSNKEVVLGSAAKASPASSFAISLIEPLSSPASSIPFFSSSF